MSGTLQKLVSEFGAALLPLGEVLSDIEQFESFLTGLGWHIPNLEDVLDEFGDVKNGILALENSLTTLIEADSVTLESIEDALQHLRISTDLISNLNTTLNVPSDLSDAGFLDIFPRQVLDFLVIDHLYVNHPKLLNSLALIGIVQSRNIEASSVRPAYTSHEFLIEDLPKILTDADSLLATAFNWGDDNFDGDKLVGHLEDLLMHAGINTRASYVSPDIISILAAQSPDELQPVRSLRAFFFEQVSNDDVLSAGTEIIPLPATDNDAPGIAVVPFVSGATESSVSINENLSFQAIGTLDARTGVAVLFQPSGKVSTITDLLSPSGDSTSGKFTFRLSYQDDADGPSVLLGTESETRFEYNGITVAFGAAKGFEASRAFVEAELNGARLVVDKDETDGFVTALLPANGIDLNFEFGLGVSSDAGVYLSGSSGLETRLPLHKQIGPARFESLSVRIGIVKEVVEVAIGATVTAKIGPVQATVKSLGIKAGFDVEGETGNFGPLDVSIDFMPPTGVGLAIDGGGFKGGGFLEYEPDDERYIGMLELQFKDKISLKAIGVLTTKLPANNDGYSLLLIITSEFQPIQLGYGFTLNGVGGLLGLNRTMNVERLRTGIRDKTLDSVLFPRNIVANANRIISDLQQVFPPSEGRFVFGPMAKIGWGTPTLITIDLGLAIELPEPVTLALLGVLKAALPDEKKKLLQLRVNFLGVIDFEKEQLSFDASLFDSKLLKFPLSGDMALRLNWGTNANFLLTVGGFHPAYEPPPMALPTLRRLTVQLLAGKNPRITLETYFAVTSNTAQFGAKAELYAGAGPFNVHGMLAFDALFQFSPFYFIADTKAMLALRRKSKSIASIKVDLTLEGTTPWKARGTAKLKICWFLTVKIRFNKTFGRSEDTRLDDIAVLPMLQEALQNSGNWEAALPPRRQLLVSIKDTNAPADRVVVHPFGTLTVNQKIVPLNATIDKVGHRRPRDGNQFAITAITFGAQLQPSIPTKETFAPAQFFDMSDEEKLTSKSFEEYDGGIRISGSDELVSDHVVRREVSYKLSYIDSQRNFLRKPKLVAPYLLAFNAWSDGGAVSVSPLSARSAGQTSLAPPSVSIASDDYVLVGMDDMQPVEGAPVAGGESQIKALMNEMTSANPALLGKIQAVPCYELL